MTKADEEMYGDTLNKLGVIDQLDRKRLMRFVDRDFVALKLSSTFIRSDSWMFIEC